MSKIILLTGASTGIGYSTAIELYKKGYDVIAGVRKQEDGEKLKKASNDSIKPIILDVTKREDIQSAVNYTASIAGKDGLYALINNAGINYVSLFEYTEDNKSRNMMEVNFFGLYTLIQKCLPLLRSFSQNHSEHSKVINVGSIGSTIGLPIESFYHASKFAVFGLSEALRSELFHVGVDVTIVMPGGIKTEFFSKSGDMAQTAIDIMPDDAPESYKIAIYKYKKFVNMLEKYTTPSSLAGLRIAQLVDKKRAPFMWLIGADAKLIYFSQKFLPRFVLHELLKLATR